MLGALLKRLLRGRNAGAAQLPVHGDDWPAVASALHAAGRNEELVTHCRAVLAARPDDVDALQWLAAGLCAGGQVHAGAQSLERAAELASQVVNAQLAAASAHAAVGDSVSAIARLRQAVSIAGAGDAAWERLGTLLRATGRYDELERCCRDAYARGAASCRVGQLLGVALFEQGRVDEAIAVVRAAIATDATDARTHSDLLRMLNYADARDPAVVSNEHRVWAQRHADVLTAAAAAHANARDPERRLRVGYVSPYFCRHAVTFFLESVLASHDRDAFEIVLYADVERPDEVSRRLQGYGCRWRSTVGMEDAALAQAVRDDQTDILVDLSGHTPGHRLLVFARKPAPVQVTWNGYPNTTGMRAMDYRITDAQCDPPDATQPWHAETLVRLPELFMSWMAANDAPGVCAPPCATTGQVTFASFNGCYKITARMVRVWARILHRVARSRLLLFTVDGEVASRRLVDLFRAEGIDAHRLELIARVPHERFLAEHARADIALDTFPYHGTTTTCFSLWMGLPVVVLAGNVFASRVGASLLRSVDLHDLVARDEDEYVAIAARLASEPESLAELRAGMRNRLRRSPITDGLRCAGALESAYRSMWQAWCRQPTDTTRPLG